MKMLDWEITKFNPIVSFPSMVGEGTEVYAQDMSNLRVDRWGHLRLRPAFTALEMFREAELLSGEAVFGVAASIRRLYWQRSDNKLLVADGIPASPITIQGVDDIAGRLSLVDEIADFVIVTSEGNDEGYQIFEDTNEAVDLGIKLPKSQTATFRPGTFPADFLVSSYNYFTTDDDNNRISHPQEVYLTGELGDYYYYAITFSNAIELTRSEIDDANKRIQNILESPAVFGKAQVRLPRFRFSDPDQPNLRDFDAEIDFDREIDIDQQRSLLNNRTERLVIENIQVPDDDRVTHMNIYRSIAQIDGDLSPYSVNYYRIAQIEVEPDSVASSYVEKDSAGLDATDGNYVEFDFTRSSDSGNRIAWSKADAVFNLGVRGFGGDIDVNLRWRDTTGMPPEIIQLAKFNDHLAGINGGEELRFSTVRDGTPLWHVFPVDHKIKTGRLIQFCANYRGQLLFGGADGLYRMSGTTFPNIQWDIISSRGPVTAHAWGVLDKAFGFVGVDGFYLTDGTQAPEIARALDGYFNRHRIEDGLVAQLPNHATFWSATRRNKKTDAVDTLYFVETDGKWIRLEGTDARRIRQLATIQFVSENPYAAIADEHPAPRLMGWTVDDSDSDELTDFSGSTGAVTELIPWSWESQQLDWNARGLGEQMKIFKQLVISGHAENDVTVHFYIDERDPVTETVTLDRDAVDRFDPLRIPIDRRGFGIRVKLEGTGQVTLRGLKLEALV